ALASKRAAAWIAASAGTVVAFVVGAPEGGDGRAPGWRRTACAAMSDGRQRKTGPRGGRNMILSSSWATDGALSADVTSRAAFVTGAITDTVSRSWAAPIPARAAGVPAPRMNTGIWSRSATAAPVTAFVVP